VFQKRSKSPIFAVAKTMSPPLSERVVAPSTLRHITRWFEVQLVDIPALTVIVSGWWRPVCARDSGWRRLTRFPNVACG
jgi:hypothetical protein